jgi:hypothetical protein
VGAVEILDRLLDRGAVVAGDCTISLANVDLVYVKLALLLSSVSTLEKHDVARALSRPSAAAVPPAPQEQASPDKAAESQPSDYPTQPPSGLQAARMPSISGAADVLDEAPQPTPQDASRSLAQLVLSLVELLRQLMERQAFRRIEGGGLSDNQIERVGLALQELETKMIELREIFGLKEEDINLDLGPLGRIS